jgi:hypothetical protein
VAADDKRLQTLLGQLAPRTRDIVLRTPIAGDIKRLESLLTLTPPNQSVVARRLDMEWTWEDALKLLPEEPSNEGAERVNCPDERRADPAEATDTANVPETDVVRGDVPDQIADLEARPGSSDESRRIVLVRLSELRPNPSNATIYRESIDDKLLGELVDHIAVYGQREPIIVDSTLMILSGERRWRALRLIVDAEYARVVIDPTQRTADEVEDLVLDDFSLKRKPSVQEQLNVYAAAVRSYTRRSGRATGRPRKDDKNLSGFWDANRIRAEAAAAAGLGSRETVRHAKWVLKHGDAETKAAMLRRDITINAAYVRLQEARDHERGTDPEPPPQLPDASLAHFRLVRQPSDIEGEPQPASVKPVALASSGEEQPLSGGVTSATAGGAGSAIGHGHEGRSTRASEVSPTQTAASGGSSPPPPRKGAPGPNGHDPEVKPTASTKAKAVRKRDHEPDARSFDRGIAAAARYVSALRKRDEVEALSARDKAIGILTAAANGDGEMQVGGIDDERTEGAEQDSMLDEEGRGSSEEKLAPDDADVDLTVPLEEAEGESTSAEPDEPDPGSQEDAEPRGADDDAEIDLTVSPEEAEGESSTSVEPDDPDPGSQEGAESGDADDDEVNALVKVKKAEYDYSDYYDDDDGDESSDGHLDDDDDEQVDSEDEGNEDDEDELKDPLDAEVDDLIGRSRARRV